MSVRLMTAFLMTMLIAADGPKDDAAKQEKKKLQGTWKVVRFEVGGKDLTAKGPKQIVIMGDDFKGLAPNVKFRIDPSKKPKTLDLIDKNNSKKVFPLIYALKGDELKIAFPLVEAGKGEAPKRPDSFQSKGKPRAIITSRRVKSKVGQ